MAAKHEKKMKRINTRLISMLLCACLLIAGAVVAFLDAERPEVLTWRRVFKTLGLGSVSDVDAPMQVHVLDVGKADCILVRCEDKNILIDSGYYDAGDQILNYLNYLQVDALDMAVVTHPDADHTGSMAKILSEIHTDRLLLTRSPQDLSGYADSYRTLLNKVREMETEVIYAAVDDSFEFGDLYVYVLSPARRYDSENDNSIVLRMEYLDTSYLFMGDAEEMAEREICRSFPEIASDFIKIGHHGSATSTTAMLLDAVKPRYAAISVGEDNSNLPKEEVLERLSEREIEFYRTDFDGTCVFYSDGETIAVKIEEE